MIIEGRHNFESRGIADVTQANIEAILAITTISFLWYY